MSRREVPAELVRAATLRTYLVMLRDAYAATELPADVLALAVTHSALATGAWRGLDADGDGDVDTFGAVRTPASSRYVYGGPPAYNCNIGVIRAMRGWDGDFARVGTVEVINGRRVKQKGQPFRAYASLADSARDAVLVWKSRRYNGPRRPSGVRARGAYDLLVAGDAAWSGELGRRGYYTASPATFERGYRIRLDVVRAILEGRP